MRRELSGRTALVTGGNVGIGRAIAIALAESGADVAVTYMTHAESDVVSSIEALGLPISPEASIRPSLSPPASAGSSPPG
jgi:NAD(P)-dependent dehydrogenase (short-subunit alcohol dehydrogenase family)